MFANIKFELKWYCFFFQVLDGFYDPKNPTALQELMEFQKDNDKEAKEFDSRNIRFIAHDSLGTELDYTIRMGLIEKMGFSTIFDKNLCGQYPQDGVVYRIDNWKRCNQLGYTSKYPRFAVALKERGTLTAETVFVPLSADLPNWS